MNSREATKVFESAIGVKTQTFYKLDSSNYYTCDIDKTKPYTMLLDDGNGVFSVVVYSDGVRYKLLMNSLVGSGEVAITNSDNKAYTSFNVVSDDITAAAKRTIDKFNTVQ